MGDLEIVGSVRETKTHDFVNADDSYTRSVLNRIAVRVVEGQNRIRITCPRDKCEVIIVTVFRRELEPIRRIATPERTRLLRRRRLERPGRRSVFHRLAGVNRRTGQLVILRIRSVGIIGGIDNDSVASARKGE